MRSSVLLFCAAAGAAAFPVLAVHADASAAEPAEAVGAAPDLSGTKKVHHSWSQAFESLRRHAYGNSGKPPNRQPVRTEPGRFGARGSRLYQMLRKGHHDLELPAEDLYRIALWLDANSNFFGAYHNLDAQFRGEVVMPSIE